jgi:MYXO-CTERM domain-containing protein
MQSNYGSALIRGRTAAAAGAPLPPLLEYADYNLFFNPDSAIKVHYGVGVEGKTVRVDPGFAYNDVPVGGAVNAPADPKFTGPIPRAVGFDEQQVVDRQTTVCQILAHYRQIYTPAPGSPLIGAGDPADGADNNIGAVGGGTADPADVFGRLCDPNDVGPPVPAEKLTCPPVPPGSGSGTGTGTGGSGPGPRGFVCVCDTATGPPLLWAAPIAALVMLALARRRRRSG